MELSSRCTADGPTVGETVRGNYHEVGIFRFLLCKMDPEGKETLFYFLTTPNHKVRDSQQGQETFF